MIINLKLTEEKIVSLNRLSGRLDLLVNQIKQNTDHDIIEDSDLLVYEDKGNKNIFKDWSTEQMVLWPQKWFDWFV